MLEGVDIDENCFCCAEIGDVAKPGLGCGNTEIVKKILEDLWPRIEKKGDMAELDVQEQIINGKRGDIIIRRRWMCKSRLSTVR
jgi:hypothetical protein